ncbi:MAG TPA: peptidylprolyl isomerase [Candidatus Saccharimonadales bacterium]|nr:peptidylprolyl isomerase [Candidatus Saccharimonadales bacterium]
MKKKHITLSPSQSLQKVRSVIPPVPKRFKRVKGEQRIQEAFENIPKITNETVAEHREHVLKGARKYKYPLQHSKHKIVLYSTGLLVLALVGFLVYTGLALYRFQTSSGFMYRVTQVLPFPVARAGSHFVAYENYLFELRRYEHYYQTQQRVDFSDPRNQDQLAKYKPVAMNEVVQAAYVKQLAAQHHISVSNAELQAELNSLQAQNQSSEQELADVTNKFFGWSIDDLKRELRQELLAQKVAATLDTGAQLRANNVAAQVEAGADFGTLAAQNSDDAATKDNGGQYANTAITAASTDVPPAVVRQLENMQVGEVSGVIQAGGTLEIVKLVARTADGKMTAAHISFSVTPIQIYVAQYQKTHPRHIYIKLQ